MVNSASAVAPFALTELWIWAHAVPSGARNETVAEPLTLGSTRVSVDSVPYSLFAELFSGALGRTAGGGGGEPGGGGGGIGGSGGSPGGGSGGNGGRGGIQQYSS